MSNQQKQQQQHCPMLLLLTTASALLMVLSSASPQSCSSPPDHNSILHIIPAFSTCSPLHPSPNIPDADPLLSLANRDVSRLLFLTSLAVTPLPRRRSFVPIASGRSLLQSTTYVARASLGTPPQPFLVALDISTDAAWFPCSSCSGCPSSSLLFSPNHSSSFTQLPCSSPQCSQIPNSYCPASSSSPCSFNLTYGGSSIFSSASQDSLSLSSDTIKSYTFGCVTGATAGTAIPPQGLLGLGRGPLSFLSQTKSLYSSTFSYCLPNFRSLNFSGTLRLGTAGQPLRIRTTPLLSNPHRPSLYYVNMTGIRVGRRQVSIPPAALAFNPATGGGTILDSGTMFTRLVSPAYIALRDEYRRRVKGEVSSLGGFDTCFTGAVVVPTITFEFDGMSMTLTEENTMIHSSSGGISCLAMAAAPENVNAVLNVIASVQQQNHRVLFDVPNGRVGVSREPCTTS